MKSGVWILILITSITINGYQLYSAELDDIPVIHQSQGQSEETGGLTVDIVEYEKIPRWNEPEPVGTYSAPQVVDLRFNELGQKLFPDPGSQQMNDCTAWATAYHLKSYLEAVDQGWVPDSESRIFSPSFIYNQINGKKDRGSSITTALKPMKEKGAVPLSVMPYTKNYKADPDEKAFLEAKKYKIREYYSIKTIQEIKKALQYGNPVLIGIVTDATFNSGKYKIYNRAMRDAARDRLGSSHGRHAMVIVGYDEVRQAFLFMNSWGTRWGEKGFCWVSYDVMEPVQYQSNGANFMEAALVAVDEKTGKSETVTVKKEIKVSSSTWFIGINQKGKVKWGWKAELLCDEEVRKGIAKIQWKLPEGLTDGTDTAKINSNLKYSVTGYSLTAGTQNLLCEVTFKDGDVRVMKQELLFRDIVRGALKLIQSDRYYGNKDNQDYWEWTIRIDGSLTDLNDIVKVIYHLHSTFENPDREVTSSPENGFSFTTRGWGTFRVSATVYFKNGVQEKFSHNLKFSDPVKKGLTLQNTAVLLENRDGTSYYNWTGFIDGPEMLLNQVTKVIYHLHPTFSKNIVEITEGKSFGFPLSAKGWGTFELKATVYFENGKSEELKHQLKFSTM